MGDFWAIKQIQMLINKFYFNLNKTNNLYHYIILTHINNIVYIQMNQFIHLLYKKEENVEEMQCGFT